MSKKIRTEAVDYLFNAILSLENKEECYTFFEDICTINELLSLSQRFEVARMLREQKTYLEIAEKTGASTATISRVNRSLTDMIWSLRESDLQKRKKIHQLQKNRKWKDSSEKSMSGSLAGDLRTQNTKDTNLWLQPLERVFF